MQKFFSTQQDDETVLMVIRQHPFVMVVRLIPGTLLILLGLIMLSVLPIFWSSFLRLPLYVPLATLLILVGWMGIYYGWVLHNLNVVIITNEHVVDMDQLGLFNHKVSELSYQNIQDVSAAQSGLIQSSFNFGSVRIQTAGETPEFEIKNVARPYEISKKILEIQEEVLEAARS